MTKRIRIVQGGTSASKTISILLNLIHCAQADETPTLTSIVSESFPHLRRGVMRDFESIMKAQNLWKNSLYDKTNSVYTFETGSQIEFFSVDQSEKVRGARRDRLFINEANNVSFMAFEELEVRTKLFIFIDYNPTNEFWAFTDVIGKRNDVEHIILTYKDNEALSKEIIDSIEQRKNRTSWWKVYGLGELGEVEASLIRRGLDFGYTNDPTAMVAIYKYNGGLIFDEEIYKTGMSNKQIADTINVLEHQTLVIADSAEPKSIDELRLYGINIQPAIKGQGSVNQGIQLIQSQPCSVTKRSVNIIKEYRNYLWETDRNGVILNIPCETYNHSMDAIRYGLSNYQPEEDRITNYKEEARKLTDYYKTGKVQWTPF